ncbi:MAG: DEAD/DEAH box helicase [Deltaproteobacteria bacterium]|nr:DEAD/DEAH box helicase [Deltaproteobacteria bacterium]
MNPTEDTSCGPEGETAATFEDFHLLPEVAEAIAGMGFVKPTPVQARTFDPVRAGTDVIVMARTGTGKTAAFGIPMAQMLDPKMSAVQALVLAPTRELALQVSREVAVIGANRGVRCAAVYGGASFTKQVEEVSGGAHIVVGTPGRVLDHMRRGTIPFGSVRILVLDEADEMLSMGFEKELSAIIEGLPASRQTMLFSATIPDDIKRLSGRYMREPTFISLSGDEVGAKEVSHFVYLVSGRGRPRDLVRVIEAERPGSAIVFCNTRDETLSVASHLKRAGFHADWLNSDLSQAERERVMASTRSGELKYLVATDVAARGIDISHISHVINYTFPDAIEVYIHRTGRTGRMGRMGAAISLIAPHDIGNLYYLRLIYKIFPVEKTLPDERAALKALELTGLDALRRAFLGRANGAYTGLARRLMQDVRGEQIMAGLLAAYFEEPGAETIRERTTIPAPAPVVEVEGPTSPPEAATKAEAVEATEEAAGEKPAAAQGQREIYVDAGRKDGLRISALMTEIIERTGLPRSAVGRVRMLTRSTFIAVPDDHFAKILAALDGMELDGRKLKAEPAKD